MYCKKCGTEQHNGQKFCPKCGEPFLDENGKPYLKGFRKDLQDAKEKLTSKAEELTQKGKTFVDKTIQPQLNEKIDEVKNTDWNKKKEEISSSINNYINDPSKIRLTIKILACIFVIWFFIKAGLSASIIWYVLIAAILFLAFKEPKAIKESTLYSKYMYAVACFALMLITGVGVSQNGEGGSWGLSDSGPKEICITMKSDVSRGYGSDVSGNYGLVCAVAGYFTDVITVPQGKIWIFKTQEIEYADKDGTHFYPDICFYNTGNTDAKPIIYNCYTQARDIPVFRENDKLRIRVRHTYIGNAWKAKSIDAKIYFIEKDDDLK